MTQIFSLKGEYMSKTMSQLPELPSDIYARRFLGKIYSIRSDNGSKNRGRN